MSNFLDTVMNIEMFAFIGLLVWLYFKRVEGNDGETSEPENRDQESAHGNAGSQE